ncbi:MAG: M20/M25/M40 family metallo-hydrolase [Deltaproteobacteria bacterium]|nr:M20/M25/M40 family metallo-hydrolase [Deltaproteobacteria bacterium]
MFRRWLAAIVLLAPLACASPGARSDSLDSGTLAADVAWLAAPEREGRGLGTEGLASAATWLAEKFAEAGLAPGAADGSFLQSFETVVAIRAAGARLQAGRWKLEAGDSLAPLMISESGVFEGTVAFVGYGIAAEDQGHDDYAGLDVEGRIVVVLEGRPGEGALGGTEEGPFLRRRSKIIAARSRGAIGVLFVPETESSRLRGAARAGDPSVRPAGVFALRLARPAAEQLLREARQDLAKLSESAGAGGNVSRILEIEMQGEVSIERTRDDVSNVIGVLAGKDPAVADEAVVIGAHYDHLGLGGFGSLAPSKRGQVHPGADDNASGSAALLAVARELAGGPAPRRTILFVAFTAEEIGLLGSAHFVESRTSALPAPVAMLNMDMVGMLRDDRVILFGSESADEWKALLVKEAGALGLKLAYEGHGTGPSDQTSFYVKSVPVLHFFTGVHSTYHTPDDVIEDIDMSGLARVSALVAQVARAAADGPRMTFQGQPATAHSARGAGRGYGPDLGTIPAFGGEPVVGVRLAGVRPGSPAERAGLRGGDVMVSFAGVAIRDLAEFAALLYAEAAGHQIELVVERGGERITIHATLGARR